MKKPVTVDEQGNLIDPDTGQILIRKSDSKPVNDIGKLNVAPNLNVNKNITEEKKPTVPPQKVYTKYEVKPDSTFTVKFGLTTIDGRVIVVDNNDDLIPDVEKHWVTFRMWKFSEELDLKSKATDYDANKKIHMLNNDKLNEIKVRTLILDWSFSEKDMSLKLLHVNKYLSDEGLAILYNLYPSVVRYIINKMNEVLEYNG